VSIVAVLLQWEVRRIPGNSGKYGIYLDNPAEILHNVAIHYLCRGTPMNNVSSMEFPGKPFFEKRFGVAKQSPPNPIPKTPNWTK